MKNIIIAIIMALPACIFAQDKIDPTPLGYSSTYSQLVQNDNSHFILGWNWGSPGSNLDDALNINTYHGYPFSNPNTKTGVNIIQPLEGVCLGRSKPGILLGLSLYLEPALEVDTNDLTFTPLENDETGAVFGFQTKTFGTSTSDGKFTISSSSYTNDVIVLKDIWLDNALKYLNYGDKYNPPNNGINLYTEDYKHLNGLNWSISINLSSSSTITPELMNETILSIQLPYKLYNETSSSFTDGYIKFDAVSQSSGTISNDTLAIIGSRGDYRGVARKYETISPSSTTWNIKGSDLATDDLGESGRYITLSASFTCNDHPDYNPILKPDWYEHDELHEFITNLDIEIKVHPYNEYKLQKNT